jgi:hypothetical protein
MDSMREARTQDTLRWTTRRARTLAQITGFAIFAAVAACSTDAPTGPGVSNDPGASGSYSITSVNGHALPATYAQDGTYLLEVTQGTLSLTTDGKFSIVTTYRQTVPDNVSAFVDSIGGTWSISGATVTFTNPDDGSTDTATWAAKQLTFVETDHDMTRTWVYAKP